jgi:hypothetical protein
MDLSWESNICLGIHSDMVEVEENGQIGRETSAHFDSALLGLWGSKSGHLPVCILLHASDEVGDVT